MTNKHANIAIAVALICLAASSRLLPHPANFAPVTAVAIFGSAILPRRLAIIVPLLAMVLSDLLIGFYHIMPIVWACYLVIALASSLALARPTVLRGAAVVISASVFFFVVTNFAVWAFDGMYAHTWAGLVESYYMALPFFRNTFLSDLVFTTALLGVYALAQRPLAKYVYQSR